MPIVQPPKPRYQVEDLGTSLRLVIPSRKNWSVVAFLSFWLMFWLLGELSVIGVVGVNLFRGLLGRTLEQLAEAGWSFPEVGAGVLFLLVWLIAWTTGGGYALYTWLWLVTGKEEVEVDGQAITIRHRILGLSRPKSFLVDHIRDVRIGPAIHSSILGWPRAPGIWGIAEGSIAFDYGARTFRFASGADEAEAKQILRIIWDRFPQYRNTHYATHNTEYSP